MSDPRPQAGAPDDAQATPEFEWSMGERLIRRAMGIGAPRRDLVRLSELKSTLATLGVPGETVDRAAAEVREEDAKGVPYTFGKLLHHLVIFPLFALPAVYGLRVGLQEDGFRQFAYVGLSAIWLFFCLGGMVDAVYLWARRKRG
jgi:hypothetical protein